MPDINKKEAFKLAIREFHERSLPDLVEREYSVPLDPEKVVTLYGPRRVGKTYYIYQLINSLIPMHGKERIIFLTPKFSYSLKVQEKNPKKIYCLDNGLRRTAAFLFSKEIGRLAENPVFLELLRRGYEVHYWKDKREVDFIAQKEGQTLAINVCYEDSIPERETEGLKGLKDSSLKADELFPVTRDTDKNWTVQDSSRSGSGF